MPIRLSYPSLSVGVETPGVKHCLVYFIPGNPGFVDYYEPFLSTLRTLLNEVENASRQSSNAVCFHILGRNLLGFDDGDEGEGAYGPAPFDLDTQIRASMDAIAAARVGLTDEAGQGVPFDEVILMGHSVGSYIALEVFHRWQELLKTPNTAEAKSFVHLRLRTGILLFATLTHLAQSPRGCQLTQVLATPLLGPNAHSVAAAFLWCWPTWTLDWILRNVLQFPSHAAVVTLRFLCSRGGVRQALFLGGDELQNIVEAEWEDELWQVAETTDAEKNKDSISYAKGDGSPPKFIIFFGKNDHWVDNECRDKFIARLEEHATRDGSLQGREGTRIVMDEKGLPHAFCIRHGEEVAEMVKTWIADTAEDF